MTTGRLTDLFAWGSPRQTIAGKILIDAASRLSSDRHPDVVASVHRVLADPIIREAVDGELIERGLDWLDTVAGLPEVAHSFATVLLDVADRIPGALTVDLRCRLLSAMIAAGELVRAHEAALSLLDLAGLDDRQRGQVFTIIGQAYHESGSFDEAVTAFRAAAGAAAAGSDQHLAWSRLFDASRCLRDSGDNQTWADYLADTVMPAARAVGDADALSATLGDLGIALMALRQYTAAGQVFEEAVTHARAAGLYQAESDWLGNLGNCANRSGAFPAAIDWHTQALAVSLAAGLHASAVVDLHNLGVACRAADRWSEALNHAKRAVQIAREHADPGSERRARVELCQLYADLGRWRDAVALYDELEGAPPWDGSVELPMPIEQPPALADNLNLSDEEIANARLVEGLLAEGNADEALSAAEQFVRDHPASGAGHFEVGLVLNMTGEFRASIAAYERALEILPRHANIHINLVNSWRDAGDLDTPLERYRQAVTDDPYDPVWRLALGRVYGMIGWSDEAIRELRESVRLAPSSFIARQMLARGLADAAVSKLEVDFDNAWAQFHEARFEYQRLADLQESRRAEALTLLAEDCYRMVMAGVYANPTLLGVIDDQDARIVGHAVAAVTEAVTLAPQRRRPAAAMDALLRLVSVISRQDTWVEYCHGLAEAGAPELAQGALEEALSRFGADAGLYYELGLLLARLADADPGRLRLAAAHLDDAVRLSPHDSNYLGARQYVLDEIAARTAAGQ